MRAIREDKITSLALLASAEVAHPYMSALLRVPDLDLPGVPVRISAWHAEVGQRVVEGERVVEITAGDVTIDLPAPVSGVLLEKCASAEQPLASGQPLARFRSP